MNTRPLLLLDVDGPLNPTTLRVRKNDAEAAAFTLRHMRPPGFEELSPEEYARQMEERRRERSSGFRRDGKPGDPLPVRSSFLHVGEFDTLMEVFDLVWATTWNGEANQFISPLVGLPTDLPHIPFEPRPKGWMRSNGSFKTPIIARWLDENHPGRAWAWVDDELNQKDRAYFRVHHYGLNTAPSHLLLRVEDHLGLRTADFMRLREFAATATSVTAASITVPH